MRSEYIILFFLAISVLSCRRDHVDTGLTTIPYDPTPVQLKGPEAFPEMPIPSDNPTTLEGIELGRRLFYDKKLSDDLSMSCSSCHEAEGSFTDNLAVSEGIDKIAGRRSSMSLLNIGFADKGLFWDGRELTLESQALLPVEDTIELHTSWPRVIERLREDDLYPQLFRQAFGIEQKEQITKERAAQALAQFERSLISSGDAKYDRWVRGEVELTDEEYLGYVMFFDLDPNITDAECGHCHNAPLFTTNEYFNNGIEPIDNILDFPDLGRAEVTNVDIDNGKFRVPTLRNIYLTAPYMHDGRFQTLDEVLQHYNEGGHLQLNKDPLIRPLRLLDFEIEALLSFLETLTDSTFVNDPKHQSPF